MPLIPARSWKTRDSHSGPYEAEFKNICLGTKTCCSFSPLSSFLLQGKERKMHPSQTKRVVFFARFHLFSFKMKE